MFTLPWPPSILSGHNTGYWFGKVDGVRKFRRWAKLATLEVKPDVPASGDIRIAVRFVPPNRRGDRTNFANRCKPVFDGIADALGVNDSRFVPIYSYADPEKPGRLEIEVLP